MIQAVVQAVQAARSLLGGVRGRDNASVDPQREVRQRRYSPIPSVFDLNIPLSSNGLGNAGVKVTHKNYVLCAKQLPKDKHKDTFEKDKVLTLSCSSCQGTGKLILPAGLSLEGLGHNNPALVFKEEVSHKLCCNPSFIDVVNLKAAEQIKNRYLMGLARASQRKTFDQCYSEVRKEIVEISNSSIDNRDWAHYRAQNGINGLQDKASLAKGIIF